MRSTETHGVESGVYLAQGSALRPLFGMVRKEAIGSKPVVTEEFHKLYVANRGEINFVDVVSQVPRLRLALNMRSHEPHDPGRVAKDIPILDLWGTATWRYSLVSQENCAM